MTSEYYINAFTLLPHRNSVMTDYVIWTMNCYRITKPKIKEDIIEIKEEIKSIKSDLKKDEKTENTKEENKSD